MQKYGFKVIEFVNKPLEGYVSYQYILVKKLTNNKKIKFSEINKLLKLNNKHKVELSKYKKILKRYTRIVMLLKNYNFFDHSDIKFKLNFIKKNKIQLLGIKKKDAINRFLYEAKKFYEILRHES